MRNEAEELYSVGHMTINWCSHDCKQLVFIVLDGCKQLDNESSNFTNVIELLVMKQFWLNNPKNENFLLLTMLFVSCCNIMFRFFDVELFLYPYKKLLQGLHSTILFNSYATLQEDAIGAKINDNTMAIT